MLRHLERCSTFKYLAVDTEGYVAQGLLGVSVANPLLESMYFPLGQVEDVNIDEEVKEALEHTIRTVPYRIMHNAGHDIIALPDIAELPFICTMVMGHMIDENVMSKSLDYMHKQYCGGDGGKQKDPLMDSIIKTQGWYAVPYDLIRTYAEVDAAITMELALTLMPLYEEQFGPIWS